VQLLKWRDRWRHYLRGVTNVCISFEITLVGLECWNEQHRGKERHCPSAKLKWDELAYIKLIQ